ncbi:MAG: sugar kinase [Chloroflexi bacterium]|nr:sugar kinase [Chloroflexota bacterium]
MTKFLTFGETMGQYNADFIGVYGDEGAYMLDCAGAESNVAVGLQKLGISGVEAVWVSRLGDDEAGKFVLDELEGRISVRAQGYDGENTGISYLNHHIDGEHFKTYFRNGSAASRLTFADVQPHLQDADILHVTGITPALSGACHDAVMQAMQHARDSAITVSFDLNYREQLWSPAECRPIFERMAKYADIFKLGHDEAEAIWGWNWSAEEYASYFQVMNGGLVVVTRGMEGAVAFDGANLLRHSGYTVDVVDPVGAGDAFVAGMLGGILEWTDARCYLRLDAAVRAPMLEHALEVANVCGALTCTRHGDTAAMPSMPEVREFVAANR